MVRLLEVLPIATTKICIALRNIILLLRSVIIGLLRETRPLKPRDSVVHGCCLPFGKTPSATVDVNPDKARLTI